MSTVNVIAPQRAGERSLGGVGLCQHSTEVEPVARSDRVEVSYIASYDCRMPVLNFRTDERSERALAELMADGSSASVAIRQALVDAVRLRRREQMRLESLALMNDEADRAESRKVLAEMDELRAW